MDGTVNDKSDAMMRRTKLSEAWSKSLSAQPETGMGFQDVEVTLKGGRKMDGIALNGSILETLFEIKEADIEGIKVKPGAGRRQ
jgi:hypothetical protein